MPCSSSHSLAKFWSSLGEAPGFGAFERPQTHGLLAPTWLRIIQDLLKPEVNQVVEPPSHMVNGEFGRCSLMKRETERLSKAIADSQHLDQTSATRRSHSLTLATAAEPAGRGQSNSPTGMASSFEASSTPLLGT